MDYIGDRSINANRIFAQIETFRAEMLKITHSWTFCAYKKLYKCNKDVRKAQARARWKNPGCPRARSFNPDAKQAANWCQVYKREHAISYTDARAGLEAISQSTETYHTTDAKQKEETFVANYEKKYSPGCRLSGRCGKQKDKSATGANKHSIAIIKAEKNNGSYKTNTWLPFSVLPLPLSSHVHILFISY